MTAIPDTEFVNYHNKNPSTGDKGTKLNNINKNDI